MNHILEGLVILKLRIGLNHFRHTLAVYNLKNHSVVSLNSYSITETPSRTPEKRLDCHRITLCTIAAQTPPTHFAISIFLISIVAGKNKKSPTTRLRFSPLRVLRPKPAAGGFRFSPLHSRAALRPPPFVTFLSLSAPSLGYSCKRASIHSIALRPAHCFIACSHHPCFAQRNQRYVLRSVLP